MFQIMSIIASIEMLFLILDDRMPNTMKRFPFYNQSLHRLGFMFVCLFLIFQASAAVKLLWINNWSHP